MQLWKPEDKGASLYNSERKESLTQSSTSGKKNKKIKISFHMWGLEKFTSHLLLLRKLPEAVPTATRSEGRTRRCGIREAGNLAQETGEGILRWVGGGEPRMPTAEGTRFSLEMPEGSGETFFKMMELIESRVWMTVCGKLWTIGKVFEVKKKN